jgi:uncharacterized membrane protein
MKSQVANGAPKAREESPSPFPPSAPSGGTWGDASPQTPAKHSPWGSTGTAIPRQSTDPDGAPDTTEGIAFPDMTEGIALPDDGAAHETAPGRRDRRPLAAAVLGVIVLLFALLSRWPLDAKLRLVGAACCAQAPTRTLVIGGSLMPVDARDAGIYLVGLLTLGMALVVGRGRAGRFPPANVAALLAGLFMAMIIDGVNSSLQARGLHHFYPTTNAIRVLTGAGAGLALAMLGIPVVNRVVWRRPGDEAFAMGYGELAGFVAAAAVVVAMLLSPRPWLYYPLSILSILGVLAGWGLINAMVIAVATRREHRAVTMADGGLLLLAGIVLTLCEVGAIDILRIATDHH